MVPLASAHHDRTRERGAACLTMIYQYPISAQYYAFILLSIRNFCQYLSSIGSAVFYSARWSIECRKVLRTYLQMMS
jgi:hypothetical protein